jgi:hypothetical protein
VIELEGKGTSYHLHALLACDIALHHFQGDRPHRRNELRAGPHTRQTFLQPGELFPQRMSRIVFDLPNNLHDANLGVDIQQQVDVIGHDFYAQNTITIRLLFLQDQLFESGVQWRMEHFPPILWAENDMILTVIQNRMV